MKSPGSGVPQAHWVDRTHFAHESAHEGAVAGRSPERLQGTTFDVIVVGGGVYGACIALESAQAGLRPLLLERSDFGGGTSSSSLRILHGGFRYLQSLDLLRLRSSVRERRWWMQSFPELVRPLPCILPLYGRGLHRPLLLRPALRLNDLLSWDRNRGVAGERRLATGRVLTPDETLRRFPGADRVGLQGAALWYDTWMLSPHRLVMEVLRRAKAGGAEVLNYVSVTEVLESHGRVHGVRAVDGVTGSELEFRAGGVVNAAGPSAPWVAGSADEDAASLFRPSLAYNLLLDCPPPADAAVAVRAPEPGSPVYFICPHRGRSLVGTGHAPWPTDEPAPSRVPEELVDGFLGALGRAIPGFDVTPAMVRHHLVGLLPVRTEGTTRLASRPQLRAHDGRDGPRGLISVAGVKFTTAPAVARKVVGRLPPATDPREGGDSEAAFPTVRPWFSLDEFTRLAYQDPATARALVMDILSEESVVYMEDLVLRRLDWGLELERVSDGTRLIEALLGPDEPGLPAPGSSG